MAAASIAAVLALAGAPRAAGQGATLVFAEVVWADGRLWGTILVPNELPSDAPADSFDLIFVFDGSGLAGQRSVGEAAPYEADYDGGRWNVQAVTFTDLGRGIHDPDGDGIVNFELTSDDEVMHHMALGHLTYVEAGVYFSCPLVPA
jgi:hypothetical protein